MHMKMTKISAKSPGLLVENFDDEIVIYQQSAQNLHRLEGAAAQAFLMCDGTSSKQEVAEKIFPRDAQATERLDSILDDLEELKLIQANESQTHGVRSPARRALFQKAAVAFASAPLVFTYMMPTAAQAQSGTSPTQAT